MERCNEIRVPSEEAVQLVEYCIQNGYKISTAESCTGGLIAAGIVDVPGASNVFEEGYVTYADRVKQKLLHVSVTTIQKYTVRRWLKKWRLEQRRPVEPIFLLRQQVMQDRKMVKMGHRQEPFTSEPAFVGAQRAENIALTVIVGRYACRQPVRQ